MAVCGVPSVAAAVCTGAGTAGVTDALDGSAVLGGGAVDGAGLGRSGAAALDVVVFAESLLAAFVDELGEGLKLSNVEFAVGLESVSLVAAGKAAAGAVVDLRPRL